MKASALMEPDTPEAHAERGAAARRELDELTFRRAQKGEEPACRALVLHYQDAVFAVLSRMLVHHGKRSLVEDLAQETFLRVFRELKRFSLSGRARISTWILTIATRLAIDELRRIPRALEPLEGGAELADAVRLDEQAERRALVRAVEAAAAQLPDATRAVLVLRVYHGLEYEEIARALDIDLGTVKSRLSRARSALRTALEVRHE